jgi:hypothetical protein
MAPNLRNYTSTYSLAGLLERVLMTSPGVKLSQFKEQTSPIFANRNKRKSAGSSSSSS